MHLVGTLLSLAFILQNGKTLWGFQNFTTPAQNPLPRKSFEIYWNVPTFQCHKYGLSFDEVSTNYHITQNSRDVFRGDQFAILYDPGMFPAILKLSNGTKVLRNGGVPQAGDINSHLNLFREHVNNQIPDKWFNGVAVIDFESWRPIFRQNWGSLMDYKTLSINLVRREHPFWNNKAIEQEATQRFEKYARYFMEETLKTAKDLRSAARWGYYGYPYCFNQPGASCDSKAVAENDRMSWLFGIEDVLLPSVYEKRTLTPKERVSLVRERLSEARRISKRIPGHPKVFTYFWYKYQDQSDIYLSNADVRNIAEEIRKDGADGIVVWGSSNDVNSRDKCKNLKKYLEDILGPICSSLVQSSGRNRNASQLTLDTDLSNDFASS